MTLPTALAAAEAALAELSNALNDDLEASGLTGRDRDNFHWADFAVDRALRDLAKVRQWVEGA